MALEWDQLELWENERIRAEVWLDTSAGGWLWSVTHRSGSMTWSTIDSGRCGSPAAAYERICRVLGDLHGF